MNSDKIVEPKNEITIRSARTDDIKYLVALSYKKRIVYEKVQPVFWKHAALAEEVQEKWFLDLLDNPNAVFAVAEVQHTIIGFAIGQIIKAPDVYQPGGLTLMIDDFCVEDTCDWNRIGKKIIEHLKERVKDKGVTQTLVVSGSHDEQKSEFLKKLGFVSVSQWYLST